MERKLKPEKSYSKNNCAPESKCVDPVEFIFLYIDTF